MYVCGPTVYDFAHIGNAPPGRSCSTCCSALLRHLYGEEHVTYVRNITDVDDKINDRAARDFPGLPLNEAIRKVTEETDDAVSRRRRRRSAACRRRVQPRATEHIAEMRAIIEKLVAGGFAYVAEDHVLFSPQAMNAANSVLPRYGALSNRSLDEMIAGARVDVAPYKRDPTDFVLWKPSKPGEPAWPSPVGHRREGRPGWHIECSAMAWKHLGEQVRHSWRRHRPRLPAPRERDRPDLLRLPCRPHGECLDAQRLPAGRKREDVEEPRQLLHDPRPLTDWPGEVLRLNMLKTHYRSADRLDRERCRREREDARRLVCGGSRCRTRSAVTGGDRSVV